MFKNYFKVALRNLLHNKVFALLNIIGLAIGMATAILIGLWIHDETSFNHYYPTHKNLAQAMVRQMNKDDDYTGSTIAIPLGTALQTHLVICLNMFHWYPIPTIVSFQSVIKKLQQKDSGCRRRFQKCSD